MSPSPSRAEIKLMKTTAIDPGIEGTGFASYNPVTHTIEYGQIKTVAKIGDKYERSMIQLSSLRSRIDSSYVIAIEDYNAYRYGGAAANTLLLMGVLYHYSRATDKVVHILNNSHWRSIYGKLSIKLPSRLREHEKDAIGQLFAIMSDMGKPIESRLLRYSKREK